MARKNSRMMRTALAPRLGEEVLRALLATVYGLQHRIELASDCSEETYFIGARPRLVVKIGPPEAAPLRPWLPATLLLDLSARKHKFRAPKPLKTADGSASTGIETSAGWLPLAVFSFVRGSTCPAHKLSARRATTLGQAVALLDKALKALPCPQPTGLGAWDIRQFNSVGGVLPHLPKIHQASVRRWLETYLLVTVERLGAFGQQLIHNDLNPDNVVWGLGEPGIIDFTDAAVGPPIQELAVALASLICGGASEAAVRALIQGYKTLSRIEPDEQRVLPDLIRARLLMTVLHARQSGPLSHDAKFEAVLAWRNFRDWQGWAREIA
jgi:Ser/Thr protein kinase RdoA (MazF antagonist)